MADTNNTLRSFRAALKAANLVKVQARMGDHDSVYVKVSKASIREGLSQMAAKEHAGFDFWVGEDGTLFIG